MFLVSCSDDRPIPENEVPQAVVQRFHASYPDASNVHFTVEHEGKQKRDYEVSFERNGQKHKTEYEYDGSGVVEDKDDWFKSSWSRANEAHTLSTKQ